MQRNIFWVALVLVSVLAVFLLNYATPEGMGLVNDSVAYVNGARNINAGLGYSRTAGDDTTRPITHFPPFYSFILAAIGWTGLDAIPAAGILNLVLFGANIFLVGALVRLASRSARAALLAAALFAVSEPLLRIHTFALSEPLFLFFSLLSLLWMWIAFEQSANGSPLFWLVLAGITASAAYLTRYVGGALIAAAVLTILIFARGWPRRLASAGVYLLAALPLIIAWTLRNLSLTGSAVNRDLAFHPLSLEALQVGLQNLWGFLLPQRFNLYGRINPLFWVALLAVILIALIVWAFLIYSRAVRKTNKVRGPGQRMTFLVITHALIYLAYLFFSMTLVDASTTFEDRILSPLYVDLLLLGGMLFARLFRNPQVIARIAASVLAVILLLAFVDDTRAALPSLRQDGQGFASTRWTNSHTMSALSLLPPEVSIYTNRLSAVNVLSNRPAFALLGPVDPVSRQIRPDYAQTVQNIRRAVQKGNAALVVFSARALLAGEDGPWLSAVVQDLPIWKEFDDGIIYGAFP